MIYNIKHNTYPTIIHCPGRKNTKLWDKLVSFYLKKSNSEKKIKSEDFITVTWNNKNYKSILEKSLDVIGLEYNVLGKEIKDWKNPIKISLIINFLKKVNTKYVIGLDSSDILVLEDLNNIIKKFKNFNCKMLFNCGPIKHPPVEREFNAIQEILGKNYDSPYLNGGAWIGEKNFCLSFFEFCAEQRIYDVDPLNEWWDLSEQFYIKSAFAKKNNYKKIKLDYESKIFQILHPFAKTIDVCFQPKLI
jgi:hypothetical protein